MKNGTFASLVSVENKKLWKRISTKVVVLILLAMTILSGVMVKVYNNMSVKAAQKAGISTTQNIDWKSALKDSDKDLETQIAALEKSENLAEKSNLDSLRMQLSQNQYRIDNNLAPNTDPTKTEFWDTVIESSMWQFVALLVIISISALVAGEFSDNTMKTMISRPYSRSQILSAKLIVSILFTAEMLLLTYVLSIIITAITFGFNGIDGTILLWISGKTVALPGFAASLFTLLLDFISSLIFVFFAFFISTVTRSRAAATGVSIATLFGSSLFTTLSAHFSWGKYIYLGDTYFTSFVTKGAPFYGMSFSFSMLYSIVWTLVLLIASYFIFEKRDIN